MLTFDDVLYKNLKKFASFWFFHYNTAEPADSHDSLFQTTIV